MPKKGHTLVTAAFFSQEEGLGDVKGRRIYLEGKGPFGRRLLHQCPLLTQWLQQTHSLSPPSLQGKYFCYLLGQSSGPPSYLPGCLFPVPRPPSGVLPSAHLWEPVSPPIDVRLWALELRFSHLNIMNVQILIPQAKGGDDSPHC